MLPLLFVSLLPTASFAHEVQPTIVDITTRSGKVAVDFGLNVEALASGIDLDGLGDTDEADNNALYEELRALDEGALRTRVERLIDQWNALPLVEAEGEPVALMVVGFKVEAAAAESLPRASFLSLEGQLPEGARAIQVNWPDGAGALVIRQQGVEEPFTGFLDEGASSAEIPLEGGGAIGAWRSFVEYIPVGFDHIVPKGLDHILFVLGLFLLSTRLGSLLWQVTAFTLAHTVTLALGALKLVVIPAAIVEPLIAASIVYVAIENIFGRGENRWRLLVVFAFGLLHGLGFASVLQEFGLPAGQFIPALLGFNVGVELGQLAVIAMAAVLLWAAVWVARSVDLADDELVVVDYPVMFRAVSIVGSLAIAAIGAWWVIERTVV